jgi:hypothetical protein
MTYLIGASLQLQFINSSNTCKKKDIIEGDCIKMGIDKNVTIDYELNDENDDQPVTSNRKNGNKKKSKYILFIEARFEQTPLELKKCSKFINYIQTHRVIIEHIFNELNNQIIYTSNNTDKQVHLETSNNNKRIRRQRALTESDYEILKNIPKFWEKNNINKREQRLRSKSLVSNEEMNINNNDSSKIIISYNDYLEMIYDRENCK